MALKDNTLRGKLLSFLRELFPSGTDALTVVGIFYEYHRRDDILDALEYLSSKGYVERKSVPHPVRKLEKLTTYKINAAGIDLCDGTTSDPGITIVAED